MAQIKGFRDYESDPIDMDNSDDLIQLLDFVIGAKVNKGHFRKYSREALMSEGWIQLQKLKDSWDPSKGVPFTKYVFKFLGGRISDGMQTFEDGKYRNKDEGSRYLSRVHQFPESDLFAHMNECGGASVDPSELSFKEELLSTGGLDKTQREIIEGIASGFTMKQIGIRQGVCESMISRRVKEIRSIINE